MTMVLCAAWNWSPELVGWGFPGGDPALELLGYFAGRLDGQRGRLPDDQRVKQTLNFWTVPGIYVLYKGDTVVYVGKSEDGGIGPRLKQHYISDHLVGRWDSFSWLSPTPINEVRAAGGVAGHPDRLQLGALAGAPASADLSRWLAEMEAIGVLLARPVENRQQPRLDRDDTWWFTQVKSDHATVSHEEMLSAIYNKVVLDQ